MKECILIIKHRHRETDMDIQNAIKYSSEDSQVIGLLFSADYCKYCHVFVPELRKVYAELKSKNIEIIFVASDKTNEAFLKYLNEHPWPHIDYDDEIRVQLRKMYDIKTIPALLFFDREGNLLEKNGRDLMVNIINSNTNTVAETLLNRLGLGETNYDSDNSDF